MLNVQNFQFHTKLSSFTELERKQSTIDKRKKTKIGESLQTLLGTFSKKKDDKIKRALSEIVGIDIETTHAAGQLEVYASGA